MKAYSKLINVLIIGSGGRELMFAWLLKQSHKIGTIFLAPGNAQTIEFGKVALDNGIPIKVTETKKLIAFAQANKIGLTIVGSEGPLCAGIVDAFQKAGLKIFGPSEEAAKMEGSKLFTKQAMIAAGVPTAAFKVFTDFKAAEKHAREFFRDHPGKILVIKADGLCGGKGVVVCKSLRAALKALRDMMVDKVFGTAGEKVVIEKFLKGPELSVMVFCDGTDVQLMPVSQDHKQRDRGDKGPNTGGMGAFTRPLWVTNEMLDTIKDSIFLPILQYLKQTHGITYRGCLYAGLMYVNGEFKVLEFNVRFGDPETQAVLALFDTEQCDPLDPFMACADAKGWLDKIKIVWKKQFAVCVVLCERPYPKKPDGGKMITNIEKVEKLTDMIIIHAGTKRQEGNILTAGGRVIDVICVADTLKAAQDGANRGARTIKFNRKFYRTDIGDRPPPIVA